MRIAFVSHMPHIVTFGGANKVLRQAAEALAAQGHLVSFVAPLLGAPPGGSTIAQVRSTLGPKQLDVLEGGKTIRLNGVDLNVATPDEDLFDVATRVTANASPNVIVVPTEDREQRPATWATRRSVPFVAVCQTPATLPFGPASMCKDDDALEILRAAATIVVNSRFLENYVRDVGLRATYVPLRGAEMLRRPVRDRLDRDIVLMVNPSSIKGIDISIALARALPPVRFGVVPGWATSADDLHRLESLHNIIILETTSDIYRHLERAAVLLVPSLWAENVPLIITEAMLAGVPVVASRVGGIPEVTRDAAILLDVRPIEIYVRGSTDQPFPSPVVPAQDAGPWVAAVRGLLTDARYWRSLQRKGSDVARAIIAAQRIELLEQVLFRNASTEE